MSLPAPGAMDTLSDTLNRIPYARFLGVRPELHGDEVTLVLPYKEALIGNPLLPALHGGAVGAFMELTAVAQLAVTAGAGAVAHLPKTIDVSVDYLRSGRPIDTFARARVVKVGRRIANCFVEAWQLERAQPIASLRGHFLMRGAETQDAV